MRRNLVIGAIAVVFGLLTLVSGGRVLFGPDEARAAAGAFVPVVLWFNFLSGAVYMAAGIGIATRASWARLLSWTLTAAIAAVFAIFILQILGGTAWEPRTLGAMVLRLGFWIVVSLMQSRPPRRAVG